MLLPELRRVQVGNHSVAYRRTGEGPPLVLLHGFLCDSRCWRTQFDGLSDEFDIVASDAPGAGYSSDPKDPFTITDWAHCLAGFLDAIGAGPGHVAGLSWGGVLAQEFYRLYPERVTGFVLADTYAGWKGSFSESVPSKDWRDAIAIRCCPPRSSSLFGFRGSSSPRPRLGIWQMRLPSRLCSCGVTPMPAAPRTLWGRTFETQFPIPNCR